MGQGHSFTGFDVCGGTVQRSPGLEPKAPTYGEDFPRNVRSACTEVDNHFRVLLRLSYARQSRRCLRGQFNVTERAGPFEFTKLGEIPFTRTFGARPRASSRVSAARPALAVA
jgi:hypothetical protein